MILRIINIIPSSIVVFIITIPIIALAHEQEGEKASPPFSYLNEGDMVSDFTLIDQDRKEISLKKFRGFPVYITFIYTNCSDYYPLLLTGLDKIEKNLKEKRRGKLRFFAITVDPEVDTPEILKRYVKKLDLNTTKLHKDFLTNQSLSSGSFL